MNLSKEVKLCLISSGPNYSFGTLLSMSLAMILLCYTKSNKTSSKGPMSQQIKYFPDDTS